MKTTMIILLMLAWPLTGSAQGKGGGGGGVLSTDCGDPTTAAAELDHVLASFIGDGQYDAIREGRWPKLTSDVERTILTKKKDCRTIVKAVNPVIDQMFPSSSPYRTVPVGHTLDEIGPYFVIVFLPEGSMGYAAMWIWDSTSLALLWRQDI